MRSILRSSRASAFWISNCRGAILDAQHEFVMGLADEFETANRQRCRNGVELRLAATSFNAPRKKCECRIMRLPRRDEWWSRTIPCLIFENNMPLPESAAIMEYLEDKFPEEPLRPAGRARWRKRFGDADESPSPRA